MIKETADIKWMRMPTCWLTGLLAVAMLFQACQAPPEDTLSYSKDIQPILASKCYTCHGPDPSNREAGLRLDIRDSLFVTLPSESTAVSLRHPLESELIRRITSDDPEYRMPPADFPKSLDAEEVALLSRWVAAGVPWENHWAFEPLQETQPPDISRKKWARNPIDHFILDAQEKQGLVPSPEADKRTLLRRLTFDLHGLPPSPEELEAFLADNAPDAYEKVVDRLLASPRYGERWARHWLDVVHYGETHGYDKDKRRPNAWPYRDYVIDAFNNDLPYHRFVEDQIAGDVLHPYDPRSTVALGFLAAGPWDFVGHVEVRDGTVDKRIVRNLDRDDIVASTISTFTSMTAQCARCHDHKFDPISQADYYSLQAVFAGIDRADRPFDKNEALHKRRVQLTRQQDQFQRQVDEWGRKMSAADSLKLIALDQKQEALQAEIRKRRSPASPADGFQSQIEPEADRPKWVQVDLGAANSIDEIRLVPTFAAHGIAMPGAGFPLRFKVEIDESIDFVTPVLLADFTDADHKARTDVPFPIPVSDATGRYVRVTATKLWKGRDSDYFFALSELQVYADGKNIALGKAVSASDYVAGPRSHPRFLVDGFNSSRILDRSVLSQSDQVAIRRLEQEVDALQRQETTIRRAALSAEEGPLLDLALAGLGAMRDSLSSLPDPDLVYAATANFNGTANFNPPEGIRPIHLLNRGDTEQPLEEMMPGTISALEGLPSRFPLPADHDEGARRAALAKWIVDKKNVLTWRSIVNRIWQHHFGRGLVSTPNDFGKMGEAPSHPALLDWLAKEFLANGQSFKQLHRLIVTSATYRQQSLHNDEHARIDGGNRYLWRANRQQLEAEAVRDAVLAVNGKLGLTMGGPGFDTFRYEDDHSPRYHYSDYDTEDPSTFRRAIYRAVIRSVPDPFMTTLDCADPSQSVPVRNETVTALQALAALNNPFMVRQAAYFAERLEAQYQGLEEQVEGAYTLALLRKPAADEKQTLVSYAEKHGLAAACRLIFAMNEFFYVD